MPPKTRKTKKEEVEEEEEMAVEEVLQETKPMKLPESDASFDRKIFVAKTGTLANSRLIKLRHPKEGCALFRISDTCFDEIIGINDGHRSFFYGESVIENGTVHLVAPFNPIFVCLPYLQKTSEKFLEIDEILKDEDFEGIKELTTNQRILKALENVTDVKDLLDVKVYRLNEKKMLEWMDRKFRSLTEALRTDVHKSLLDSPEALDRHVFSFFIDFLSPSMIPTIKTHLNIQEATELENQDQSMKRKATDEGDEYEKEKPIAKKPKESIQTKKLQAASKGTKSISAFFGKKT
uniref:RNase_H2-Ydr279 domain-containing protein n=1 Tax=Caenorhabditis tropicalis TaxID=1561998 RepID=A0A1I7TPC0_9PELO